MRNLFIAFALAVAFIGCTNQKTDFDQITQKEKSLFDTLTLTPDTTKANELIKLYEQYASNYPDDSNSIKYLFRSAEICSNIGKAEESVIIIDKIIKTYPEDKLIPIVMHYKGFLYEERIKDLDKAKKSYEDLIKAFPNSDLAVSAQACIDNLGKTDLEIIKEFEKMQSESTDSNSVN